MKKSELKQIIKECYDEILKEDSKAIDDQIENLQQKIDHMNIQMDEMREDAQNLRYGDVRKYHVADDIKKIKKQKEQIQKQIDNLERQKVAAKEQEHRYSNIRK